MAKFFDIIKLSQDTTSGGGVSSARNNSNRPRKPNSAPPIPGANTPNIRPKSISEKDLLTTRSDSALGEKTAGFGAIKQDYDYGKYLLKHKYNMMGPGRKLGISYGTLLKHDLDKFKPNRYRLYSDWFFSPMGTKGVRDPELKTKWRESVQEHYENNPHHAHKIGKEQDIEHQLEALVDWYSVSKTRGDTLLDFEEWYAQNRHKLPLTAQARILADFKLLGEKPYYG